MLGKQQQPRSPPILRAILSSGQVGFWLYSIRYRPELKKLFKNFREYDCRVSESVLLF